LLAERAAANAAQVEAAYGAEPVDEPNAPGPDSEEDVVQEYENEEQLATVTVVEDFDIDALIHPGAPSENPSNRDQDQAEPSEHRPRVSKPTATARSPEIAKKKITSSNKIKYETKAVRLAEGRKQRARKLEKTARAGGRRSHPSNKRK
jgi:ribosomal RNA-processing protein 17